MAVAGNVGQSCLATTRLVVHESIAAEYTERLVAAVSKLLVGPGLAQPDLGPLASAAEHAKVLAALAAAVGEGAEILSAESLTGPGRAFPAAAVVGGARNDMRVAREEIFDPVQTVLTFDDPGRGRGDRERLRVRPGGSVLTSDISLADWPARRLAAGQVQINGYPLGGVETPFGGYKHSGLGREKGLAALEHYTQLKTVIVDKLNEGAGKVTTRDGKRVVVIGGERRPVRGPRAAERRRPASCWSAHRRRCAAATRRSPRARCGSLTRGGRHRRARTRPLRRTARAPPTSGPTTRTRSSLISPGSPTIAPTRTWPRPGREQPPDAAMDARDRACDSHRSTAARRSRWTAGSRSGVD